MIEIVDIQPGRIHKSPGQTEGVETIPSKITLKVDDNFFGQNYEFGELKKKLMLEMIRQSPNNKEILSALIERKSDKEVLKLYRELEKMIFSKV